LLLMSFFQRIKSFLFFTKSQVDCHERCRTDVLPFRQFFEFAQRLLGFSSISGDGIGVAEKSLIPGTGIGRFSFLQFSDCAASVALLTEREPYQNAGYR